ncbi:MAG: hypothetical protein PVG16_00880, partial [Chromatiales bacterium]
ARPEKGKLVTDRRKPPGRRREVIKFIADSGWHSQPLSGIIRGLHLKVVQFFGYRVEKTA